MNWCLINIAWLHVVWSWEKGGCKAWLPDGSNLVAEETRVWIGMGFYIHYNPEHLFDKLNIHLLS